MSDSRHALLVEMVRVLTSDAALGAMIDGRVFDGVPQGAVHPFLSLGEITSVPLDGDEGGPIEHRIEIEVHSRSSGRREASEVAEKVTSILDGASLAPVGHRLVALRHRETSVTASREGRAYKARIRLRAVTDAS